MRKLPILPSGSAMSTVTVAVLAQHRHQVGDRVLPPVHLAVLQRGGGGRRVRHHDPFDAVDQHPLAAREP